MTNEEMRRPLIGAIRGCTTRPLLDCMFKMFKVADTQAKVDALKEAMYNPEVFFSSGDVDLNRQYETLVGAFLSRIWEKD